MKASQIRIELQQQHGNVRVQIAEVRDALSTDRDRARDALARLAGLVQSHNKREEELLRHVLPSVDAWGPARTEIMMEEHGKEHDETYDALVKASASADASAEITRLLAKLEEHMANEEKTFLTEDVLNDDTIVRDYVGG